MFFVVYGNRDIHFHFYEAVAEGLSPDSNVDYLLLIEVHSRNGHKSA